MFHCSFIDIKYFFREGKGKKNDEDDIDWGMLKPGILSLIGQLSV